MKGCLNMKLREKMDTFVYGQGYTIRKKELNKYGEREMLRVGRNGFFDFVKYSDGIPWGRFLTERAAQHFMVKNGLSADEYEVVKAKHPKYMELIDENYPLYRVHGDALYVVTDRENVSVKYFDDAGNIQDYPNIPQSIKKSNIISKMKSIFRKK